MNFVKDIYNFLLSVFYFSISSVLKSNIESIFNFSRKMLNPDDESSDEFHIFNSNVIHPDCRVDSIFKNTEEDRLNIFKVADIPKLKDHSMKQWREWDENAAT